MNKEMKKSQEVLNRRILEYIDHVRPGKRGWTGALENLKSFLYEVIEEDDRDINLKVRFFEQSVDDLKKRFASSLSSFQQANMDIWLGQCFEKFGVWDKALASYESAAQNCDDKQHHDIKAEAVRSAGHIFGMRNEWKKALDNYGESLQLSQQAGDKAGEANAYSGMGIVYFERGKSQEASTYWEKGRELAEKSGDTKVNAQILNNLGVLMSMQGESEKALAHYGKSASLFEQSGDYRGLAEAYHNTGMTYADMKRYIDAGEYYEKSNDIARKIGDVRLQAMVKLNRIELYTAINDIFAGLAMCNQALQTFVQIGDHLGEAETYKFMGILYTRTKEWDLASAYFEDCIHMSEKYKNPLLLGEAWYEYGVLCKEKGDIENAAECFNKALEVFKSVDADQDIEKTRQALASLKA